MGSPNSTAADHNNMHMCVQWYKYAARLLYNISFLSFRFCSIQIHLFTAAQVKLKSRFLCPKLKIYFHLFTTYSPMSDVYKDFFKINLLSLLMLLAWKTHNKTFITITCTKIMQLTWDFHRELRQFIVNMFPTKFLRWKILNVLII